MLDKIRSLGKVERGCWGHVDVIKVEGGAGCSGCLSVVVWLVVRGIVWSAGFIARRGGWGDSHEIVHGAPVCARASAAGGCGGRLSFHQGSVDVVQCSRLHTFSAFGAAPGDDGAVNCVRRLLQPFVFTFAANRVSIVVKL